LQHSYSISDQNLQRYREFVHPLQWAFDHPSHSPRKSEIHHAVTHRGQKGCCTFDRGGQKPYIVRYLHTRHLQTSLSQQRPIYYVSNGKYQLALLYLDVDLHEPYQKPEDGIQAKGIVNGVLKRIDISDNRWVSSSQGHNGYLPVICHGYENDYANRVFARLEHAIRRALAQAECLADFEIKGRFGWATDEEYNWKQYGKLPLHAHDFNQSVNDGIFEQKLGLARLEHLCESIEREISVEVLEAHKARKKSLQAQYQPSHVLVTPEIEQQLKQQGKDHWKRVMVGREVRDDGDYISAKWINQQPTPGTSYKRYWTYLKELAIGGVPEPDHLFEYLFQLSRALIFREYYELPIAQRIERTVEDLTIWVQGKHNDHVTRLNEVPERIKRLVSHVVEFSSDANKAYYAQMRENDRAFPHRIQLLSPLLRNISNTREDIAKRLVDKCINKEPIDTPLPGEIERQLEEIVRKEGMRKREGQYPFVKFARRLLNAVWYFQGRAHINRETMLLYLDGKNPNQQLQYKKLLAANGLICDDWERYIRRGQSSALYRLTPKALQLFQERFQAANRGVGS
jgi:hypothetical protein